MTTWLCSWTSSYKYLMIYKDKARAIKGYKMGLRCAISDHEPNRVFL